MPPDRQTVTLVGVGNFGRLICEELAASPDLDVVILSRGPEPKTWMKDLKLSYRQTDYSLASVLGILNETQTTTLISFLNIPDPSFVSIHADLFKACQQSKTCKRIIPSEWAGDCEQYPDKPGFYGMTREPLRQELRKQNEVEWTLVNIGYLSDYFIPKDKTNFVDIAPEFPIDFEKWHATIRGSGEELQSIVAAKDVGKAVVELCKASRWEPYIFVAEEWTTFHAIVKTVETFYGREMPKAYKSKEEIEETVAKGADGTLTEEIAVAQIEEMLLYSQLTVPKEKTLAQREKYFKNVEWTPLTELLKQAEGKA